MSKIVPVRMSDELVARIDGRTENRSALIVAAVEMYLSGEVAKPLQMIIDKPQAEKKARVKASPREIEGESKKTAVLNGCPKHPGVGWEKAGGWWCNTCGKVV